MINPIMVNDVLTSTLFPQPLAGETFLLKREGVSLEVKSSIHGKLTGSGLFFLTNMRLVFHCATKKSQGNFVAYQLDLHEITDPKFEQPIFGANYLRGNTLARQAGDVGDSWKIVFYKGGAGTFLGLLNDLLTQVARGGVSNPGRLGALPVYVVSPQNVAFMDPTDPSVVYVQQPIPASSAPPAAE